MGQAGGGECAGVGGADAGRGGGGHREGSKSTEEYPAWPDPVRQGAEDGLQHDLGSVIECQQHAERKQRDHVAGGIGPQAGRDAVGSEGGGEPGGVQRPRARHSTFS